MSSKTNKVLWTLIVLLIVGLIVYNWFSPRKEVKPIPNYQELVNDIDSLNKELSLLQLERDSLHNMVDSSKAKVEVIERWYEKDLIDITNQSIADDVVFFTEYLSEVGK